MAFPRSIIAACCLAIALFITAAARADEAKPPEKVAVVTGLHDNYARIVFDWPEKVDFEAHVDGKTLTVKFARPLTADLEQIPRRLAPYAESVALDGDATVTVALKQPFAMRSFALGKRVAVDLLEGPAKAPDPEKASDPPKTPDPPKTSDPPKTAGPKEAKPAAAAPASDEVPVSVVENGNTRRLVFDWPVHVGYASSHEKGVAHIRFKQAGHIDEAALASAVPDLAPAVTAGGKEVTVALKLPPGSRYRMSRSGKQIYFDLTMPGKRNEAKAARDEKAAPEKSDPEKPSAEKAGAEKAGPDKASSEKASSAAAAPAAAVASAPPTRLVLPAQTAVAQTPPAQAAAETPPEKAAAAAPSRPPPTPAETSAAAAPAPAPAAGPLALRYGAGDDGATLRFEWKSPVPAAVFRRGPYLWVVFGAPLAVDLDGLKAKGKAAISAVLQVPHGTATILRLTTLKGFNPSIRRADNAWILTLTPQFLQPDAPVGVKVQPTQPARIFFGVREPGTPVVFRDPEIGDTLIVVPVGEVGQGVAREERLVDVTALLTVQGIALRPANAAVTARPLANGVEVTMPGGLVVSGESDRALRRSEAQPRLFDFADWYGPKDADFLAQRRAMQQVIVTAAPISRSGARFDLARFYFAHGYAAEARGVIEAIRRDDPGFAADPRFRAVAGAVMLLDNDPEDAARDLDLHALDDEQDVALWRGSLAYEGRDWPRAAAEFSRGEALLRFYPKRLRNHLALQAAEAALATGQQDDAKTYLDFVLKDTPPPGERAAARYLAARAQLLAGDAAGARKQFDRLAASDDRPTRARATMARTLVDLDSGAITRGQAIAALDGLRFAWRGDDFELNLLRRLGELKIQDGDYRGGIEVLHQAMTNFADHPEHNAIAVELANAFSEVFVGSAADDVPPLRALALYEEFKDLMPAGAKGDEIIRKLADRLVAVDLLDRAAGLLEEQVKFRLTGRDKARVATRLALVRLLDRKPQAALAALDIDVGSDIEPELLRQRQQLRARSLLELGRADEALSILANDDSRDADRLRADIAWRTKRWGEAAKIFARLAPAPDAGGRLGDDGARTVLNWATALTLAGEDAPLADLARRYAAAMEASPYRDAFRVITGGVPAGGDIRQLVDKVAQVNDLQSFMASYRQRLSTDRLSAIN